MGKKCYSAILQNWMAGVFIEQNCQSITGANIGLQAS